MGGKRNTSLIKESNVDVLIIGAGPAGLMAAHALAKSGVNVRIVDQRPDKVAAGQADGIQPRTIESYDLAERLLREGNQVHMAAFYNPSASGGIALTDRVRDVAAPSARFPFEVTLHQGAIEAIFLDSMESLGVKVCRPLTPTSIQVSENDDQLKDVNSHPVRVSFILGRVVLRNLSPLDDHEESEIVHAKFVIGADGAHSWVRKTLSLTLDGEQTTYIWGVVDMTPDTDFPDIRNRCAIHSNNGSCMIIPREDDKVRLYVQLGDRDAVDEESGRVDKSKIGPHELLDATRKIFYPYTFKTPESFDWWTIYIIGQRVASKFSVKDRVFIAGDACHTHSPKAGQGMNASMNDTHNLAWKLTQVLRGWADISLLQTYELERRKYAQDLISFDRQFAKLFSGKPRTEEYMDGVSHEDFFKIFQTFSGFTSGIGIHYAPSLITDSSYQAHAKKLIIGQRVLPQIFVRAADSRPVEIQDLLPADSRFKLIVFVGNSSDATRRDRIRRLAEDIRDVLRPYSPDGISAVFEIIPISCAKKADVRYNDLSKLFGCHWSKVLIDDTDVSGKQGGDGYSNYGVEPLVGAIIVVRPDGYVGMVAPFENVKELGAYFVGFMKVSTPLPNM
ncbi:hypothetical protein K443DRAFT_92950 [Laccaria amethystina LaAM-08-1]|uniref:Phenol 2-monooxygenase n=1 Tax=Laccaria amethystina LaAM-08-1 TaxID=1095629 RepID=A0A0C9Y978_9AGAR|nr:hypothetical protein K443DRAFT_92950 [Laccaria amethystina LaAM-08-1]